MKINKNSHSNSKHKTTSIKHNDTYIKLIYENEKVDRLDKKDKVYIYTRLIYYSIVILLFIIRVSYDKKLYSFEKKYIFSYLTISKNIESVLYVISYINSFVNTYFTCIYLPCILYLLNSNKISLNYIFNTYIYYLFLILLQQLFKFNRPFWIDNTLIDNIQECDLSFPFPSKLVFINTNTYFLFFTTDIHSSTKGKSQKKVLILLVWVILFTLSSVIKLYNKQTLLIDLLLSVLLSLISIKISMSFQFVLNISIKKLIKTRTFRKIRIYIIIFCFALNFLIGCLLIGIGRDGIDSLSYQFSEIESCKNMIFELTNMKFGSFQQIMNISFINTLIGIVYGVEVKKVRVRVYIKIMLRVLVLLITIGFIFLYDLIENVIWNIYFFYYVLSILSCLIIYINSIVIMKYN